MTERTQTAAIAQIGGRVPDDGEVVRIGMLSLERRSDLREVISAWVLCALIAAAAVAFSGDLHGTTNAAAVAATAAAVPDRT